MSGSRDTSSALSLPPREAIRFFLGKTNTPSERWSDVWEGAHNRAFMVAGAASDALLEDFRREVLRALEEGTTLADFRRAFDGIVEKHGWAHTGTPGWRAQIIFETNLSMAYSAGRYAQMTEPGTLAVFPYWQYVHSGSRNPRAQHRAWDTKILPATDPWWKTHYPPNGWNCGCRVRPLSARDLRRQDRTPDKSPEVVMRSVSVPGRGNVQVPDGIDPGFAYNVGAGFSGMPRPPGGTRWEPPEGWTPPAPRAQAMAIRPPVRTLAAVAEVRALDEELRGAYAPWASSLTAPEREAIGFYRSKGMALNLALREGLSMATDLRSRLDALRAAVGRAMAPRAVTVTRGVSPAEARALGAQGDAGVTRAFVSASINPVVADAFADRRAGSVVEIRVPAGARGVAYIHNIPRTRPEQFELLVGPGVRYRVVRRTRRRIVLEIEQP